MQGLYQCDCLEGLKKIPSGSVDLVVTDPPYNIGKAEWDRIDNYVDWCMSWMLECQRVLKDNGVFYWFHNDMQQASQIMEAVRGRTDLVFLSFLVWDKGENYRTQSWKQRDHNGKNALRSWFPTCEYIFHYVKGGSNRGWNKTGVDRIYSNPSCFEPLKAWYASELARMGISKMDIAKKYTDITGKKPYMLRHYFQNSQFGIPTRAVWESVYMPLGFSKEYEDMRKEYEDMRYTHHVDACHKNILEIPTIASGDRSRIHVCQKPQPLLRRIIRVSSNPGDTVLDPFAGSASTLVAAYREGRQYVGFEKDTEIYARASAWLDAEMRKLI